MDSSTTATTKSRGVGSGGLGDGDATDDAASNALSDSKTATNVSKALGALAVALTDIRASQHRVGADRAARGD